MLQKKGGLNPAPCIVYPHRGLSRNLDGLRQMFRNQLLDILISTFFKASSAESKAAAAKLCVEVYLMAMMMLTFETEAAR